jgi:hypothetical protein
MPDSSLEAAMPPAAPSSIPTPTSTPAFTSSYADVDAGFDKLASPPEPGSEAPASEAPNIADIPPADAQKDIIDEKETTPEETTKTDTPPKATEKPAPKADLSKPKKPADFLREKLSKVEKERDTFKAEIEKLKATPTGEDPEKKTLAERIEAQTKELETLREELKFTDYSKSGEFKEKFEKPFVEAYQSGLSQMMGFKVTDEDGTIRQMTQQDFDRLMGMSDTDFAENAPDMLGKAINLMTWNRQRILDLNSTQRKALEEFRKVGGEREKQRSESQQAAAKRANEIWERSNKEAIDKHPEFFKPDDTDPKTKELLTKGFNRADAAFNGGKLVDKDGQVKNLSQEELVALHSEVRNKAAAFNTIVYRMNKLKSELEGARKELAQYKASEPGKADGERKEKETQADTMEGVLSSFDKMATPGGFFG